MSANRSPARELEHPLSFGRVLVGVDGSTEAIEAARQAAVLLEPGGELTLLAVHDVAPAVIGGTGVATPPYFDEDLQRKLAEEALERTRQALLGVADPVGKLARGNASDELIREIAREQHALLALGSHGRGRARGLLVGSTATQLIHKAPCSVLVARAAGEDFPRRIVVGLDGSPQSRLAYASADSIGERFQAEVRAVVAHGGKGVDEQLVGAVAEAGREDRADKPVDALVASAGEADLVVVGSRGLHGVKSLGSVSERVAHRAPCSVLIVREPTVGAD